jgi:hypothetical protein
MTLVNNSDLDLTVGGAYVTLTDGLGQKVSGADVSFGLGGDDDLAFTEVAYGIYRLLVANVVVGSVRVRRSGFLDVAQPLRSLAVGSFPEIPITLTQSSLVATICKPRPRAFSASFLPMLPRPTSSCVCPSIRRSFGPACN